MKEQEMSTHSGVLCSIIYHLKSLREERLTPGMNLYIVSPELTRDLSAKLAYKEVYHGIPQRVMQLS
jgi:hypothetical protein